MKVLLYSGGTDSWLISKIWKPDVLLYVDMVTRYSPEEIIHISDTLSDEDSKKLNFALLSLGEFEDKKTAFIPARNMYLLLLACNYGDEICLGSLKDDEGGVADMGIDFLTEAERLLNRLYSKQAFYEGKKIRIETEFVNYTKDALLGLYLEGGGDINKFKKETFSCYTPNESKECLGCKACFRKFVACYKYGAEYSEEELLCMYDYIEKNVVHRSHHAEGRYFLDKPNGQEILEVIERLYQHLGKELDLE